MDAGAATVAQRCVTGSYGPTVRHIRFRIPAGMTLPRPRPVRCPAPTDETTLGGTDTLYWLQGRPLAPQEPMRRPRGGAGGG